MSRVTSTQSLLYASPSDITIERIRALVKQVGPESSTVEYKAQMADTIARGVAALANTYGGLLLVGVTDDRIVKGIKEKAIESVAEHCAAKIEPPWVPEIIPVPLGHGSDLYVLVLRVVPGRYPRPLLVDGIAYVRHQNTTHPADWRRLRDLFAEVTVAQQGDAWQLQAPELPKDSGDEFDLVLRSGLNFTVAPEATWRPLAESTVSAFIEALNRSSLHSALKSLMLTEASTGGMDLFQRRGLNHSRMVRLAWTGVPDGWPYGKYLPVEATIQLELPDAYGQQATHMRVVFDVVVRRSTALGIIRRTTPNRMNMPADWRISPRQLAELIAAVLATFASRDVAKPLAELSGLDSLAVPQPRVMHIRSRQPVDQVLDFTGLEQIPQNSAFSRGAQLLADPALDLTDDKERDEQVRRWLIQIALDAGLTGMEDVLARSG